jgi:uncharacterized lipoprotein
MTMVRWAGVLGAIPLLAGCHSIVSRFTPNCHSPQEYQRAAQVAPLKVPPGLDAPNVQSALVIPDVDVTPPAPGPRDACLEAPPRYKPSPTNKAASG